VRDLPNIRRVLDGALGFGPQRVEIEALGDVIIGQGRGGFRITARAPTHMYRLGWIVALNAFEITANGSERARVGGKALKLRRPVRLWSNPVDMTVGLSGKPALYRFDLEIRSSGGRVLGRYSEYARVVAPTIDVMLALSTKSIGLGESLFMSLENRGTLPLGYGLSSLLERREGAEWVSAFSQPQWYPASKIEIPGGAVAFCEAVRLPPDLAAGEYRISKRVTSGHRRFWVRSVFHVV
jgi:hypothetical protein